MSGHTPGPWKVKGRSPSEAYGSREVTNRANGLVAVCWSGFKGEQAIADANARLIAAAPDLLEALEDVAEWLDRGKVDGVGFDDASVLSCVREALAKVQP